MVKRGEIVYDGCGYIFTDETPQNVRENQCKAGLRTSVFIPNDIYECVDAPTSSSTSTTTSFNKTKASNQLHLKLLPD